MKKLPLFGILILFTLSFCLPPAKAKAQTVERVNSSFSLYCEESDIIQKATVEYNTRNFDASQRYTLEHSIYEISASPNQIINFSIPFISSAINAPLFQLQVDGKPVKGEILYGERFFYDYENIDIPSALNKTYPPDLDDSIMGTLYLFKPEKECFTVNTTTSEKQSLIYQTLGNISRSTDKNRFSLTIKDAFSLPEYVFFVTNGDFTELNITDATYEKETLSCKNFINRYYSEYKEFYEEYDNLPVEFFYAEMNEILINPSQYEFNEIFFYSFTRKNFNTYNFSVYTEKEHFSISCEKETEVLKNSLFSPAVYMVEQIRSKNYPIDYKFCLNEEYPYLLESSTTAKKEGSIYHINASDGNFYYIFSSSKSPKNLLSEPKEQFPTWLTVIFYIIEIFAVLALTVLITMIIQYRKNHKF